MPTAWLSSLWDVPEIGAAPFAVLGALVSGPPLAPYGLIRRARRTVFGRGSLYLEAMLCDSNLVETASKDGVELVHEFRALAQLALRERVLGGGIPVAELRAATRCERLELSPLLFLEEQLVWAYVSQQDPAPECDRLLSDCLLSIVREDRHQILDWAAGALCRLPDLVVTTPAAWLLSELCNALRRETRRVAPPPVEQIEPGLLQEVLPLFPSALVGFYRDGATLSLGPINRLRRLAFAVPGIALRPVTVTWTETEPTASPIGRDLDSGPEQDGHAQRQRRELTVDVAGDVDLIPVSGSAVLLRNAAGAVVSLRPFESGTAAPELIELDESLDLLEDTWRNARSVTAIVTRAVSPAGAIVRFADAWAISAHLRFERYYLEETGINPRNLVGSQIDVVISSFERRYQRIMCRPAPPVAWSAGLLSNGMEVEARFDHAVNFGLFVDVPTTERGFDGPTIKGLVYNSELPRWWLKRVGSSRRGDRLQLRVLAVNQEGRQLILGVADDAAAEALSLVSEGDVFSGRVVKIMPFGVFLEILPGFDALLHNTEIAAGREPAVGEEMRVRVIRVNHERNQASLATEPPIVAGAPFRSMSAKPRPPDVRHEAAPADGKEIRVANAAPPSREVVAEFLRLQLRQTRTPISLVSLSIMTRREFGLVVANNWMGYKKFKLMLIALIPEVTIDTVQPGHAQPL